MIWYKFHVGDYITHTLHLSDAEDLAYRRLLDLYYMTEKPIPNDLQVIAKKVRLDLDVVEPVLKEFFSLTPEGWLNQRCDEEIKRYSKMTEHNQKIAKKGGSAPRRKAVRTRASKGSQQSGTKVEPNGFQSGSLTDTDTDTEKEKKHPSSTASTGFEEFWSTWPASKRKVGKAACEKKWIDRKLDLEAKAIVAHVRVMKQTQQWREGFEPSPITYINQSRWLDGNPEGDTSVTPMFAGRRVL